MESRARTSIHAITFTYPGAEGNRVSSMMKRGPTVSWLFWMLGIGVVPIVLFVLVMGGLLLFFTGSISVDGFFAMTQSQGTLTCWHCGEETRAGLKTCTHCGGELQ